MLRVIKTKTKGEFEYSLIEVLEDFLENKLELWMQTSVKRYTYCEIVNAIIARYDLPVVRVVHNPEPENELMGEYREKLGRFPAEIILYEDGINIVLHEMAHHYQSNKKRELSEKTKDRMIFGIQNHNTDFMESLHRVYDVAFSLFD